MGFVFWAFYFDQKVQQVELKVATDCGNFSTDRWQQNFIRRTDAMQMCPLSAAAARELGQNQFQYTIYYVLYTILQISNKVVFY